MLYPQTIQNKKYSGSVVSDCSETMQLSSWLGREQQPAAGWSCVTAGGDLPAHSGAPEPGVGASDCACMSASLSEPVFIKTGLMCIECWLARRQANA